MIDENISRRNFIKKTALTIGALIASNFIFCDEVFAAKKICSVRTRYGTYNGFVDKNGIQTWLGIPYAKPPVGKLRWHAPEKLAPSDKEFKTKKFGYSPMQLFDPTEKASSLPQSENCLTLNIWAGNPDKKNKPVMVFIPGGGFVGGGTGDPLYNGAKLAAHDVVVVTINYRLNIFGFMNLAAIDSDFADTGYLGIKDQVAALEWVRENILEFGGDPCNVTIFGESAGAASAIFLMVTPAAKNLFHKAIVQSGHLAFYHTPEQSAKLAAEFMELGGYKNMRELMNKPTKEIMLTYEKLCEKRLFTTEVDYFPTCDGKFLPTHPLRALKDGAAAGIKLLTGTTAEEYRYWNLYDENFTANIEEFHSQITPLIYEGEIFLDKEIYHMWEKNHPNENYLEFANQINWRVGQELAAEYQSAFDDVFFYLFSQKSPNELLGSCHAIDLPFVFDTRDKQLDANPPAHLVKEVQAAWTSFAKTGNPGNALIPTWKKYTADDRQTMEINSAAWTCHKNLNTANLTELRHVYEENLLD